MLIDRRGRRPQFDPDSPSDQPHDVLAAQQAGGHGGPKIIVVGYNGSSGSSNALIYAMGMAQRAGSKIVIAEIHPRLTFCTPPFGPSGLLPTVVECDTGSLPTEMVAYLHAALPGRWQLRIDEGDPVSRLERISDEFRCDVIVVGKSGSRIRHPLGSVSGRLIRHSRQPVIVVP